MKSLIIVFCGTYGVHLIYSATVMRWGGFGPGPKTNRHRRVVAVDAQAWLTQAGLEGVHIGEFLAVVAVLFALGALGAYAMFGALLPALLVGVFAGTFPAASYRSQRRSRRATAHEAWPRIIEEIRVLTSAAGHSVPQAMFEAGQRAPDELREAFEAAHREWLLSTDFSQTVAVLKARLADPTADATCETLLVAHEVGGSDLDSRLSALAADRIEDVQTRKNARAQQAGARFARKFVLVVPLGMAAAGLSVGTGRHAYQSAQGQLIVLVALSMVIGCWVWAGQIMRMPAEERIFDQ